MEKIISPHQLWVTELRGNKNFSLILSEFINNNDLCKLLYEDQNINISQDDDHKWLQNLKKYF